TLLGGFTNRAIAMQLRSCTLTREATQTAHCHVQLATSQNLRIIYGAILTLLPDLYLRAFPSRSTNTHPFRMIIISTERRRAAGTNHLVATLMFFMLFAQALFQHFHQFF